MIEGVIFDIGGVLATDVGDYLFEHDGGALAKKYTLDPKLVSKVGGELWQKYAYTTVHREAEWKDVEKEYWNEFNRLSGLNIAHNELVVLTQECTRPVAEMDTLLQWLKEQQLDLMICSNNTEFFYQHQKKVTGLGEFFDPEKIALSCRFGAPKDDPKAKMFKALEKQMRYPKEHYLFVDDRPGNIKAALEFGVVPLYFPAEAEFGSLYLRKVVEMAMKS